MYGMLACQAAFVCAGTAASLGVTHPRSLLRHATTVLNKCLTILLNVLIWDQHAPPSGIFCLFVCIAGGMIYEQSPMRGERKAISTVTADDDEFKADISGDVHEDEEMAELIEKSSPSATNAKRRG